MKESLGGCKKVQRTLLAAGALALSLGAGSSAGATQETNRMMQATGEAKQTTLPKVLIFGDSISGGYGDTVIKQLAGKAEVIKLGSVAGYRIKEQPIWQRRGNAANLSFGSALACSTDLDRFERHLSETKYDCIHFNFGLNDIFRGREGAWYNPPEQYAEHLRTIVALLKTNGAKIIWATTTPIPDHDPDRPAGDDVIYNAAAEKVMKANHIPINDLYSVVTNWAGYAEWKKGNDVHFGAPVYQMLGQKIAAEIEAALKEPPNGRSIVPAKADNNDFFGGAKTMEDETVFFSNDVDERSARLLFKPERVLTVRPANSDQPYVEGRDYAVDAEAGVIRLLPGSAIPSFNLLTDVLGTRQFKSLTRPGQPLLFGEGDFMHSKQVRVTYTHRGGEWEGQAFVPRPQPEKLPNFAGRLRAKTASSILVVGDSISAGYNASGFLKVPPCQSPYAGVVVQRLQQASGAALTLHNVSQAGATAAWGSKQMPKLLEAKPDLAIIAFGMNDAGRQNHTAHADAYEQNIRALIEGLRHENPHVDLILVANMLPNEEFKPHEGHFENRKRLYKLAGEFERVAVADVMAVTEELLKRKKFADISGNNVNHPNDFLHRVYAEVILTVIGAAGQ